VDGLARLSPKEARNLLIDASVFVRDFYPNGHRSGLEVTALCEGNDLRSVFVANRRTHAAARSRWRSLIRNLNLDAAMPSDGLLNRFDHARAGNFRRSQNPRQPQTKQ